MDKENFTKMIGNMFRFFASNKMPNTDQVGMWFSLVEHVPAFAIDEILRAIYRDHDSLPRNIPKAILEAWSRCPTLERAIRYDPVEDFRFPLAMMWDGLRILEEQGDVAFTRYAESVAMPRNDRERVRCKLRVIRARDVCLREPGEEG